MGEARDVSQRHREALIRFVANDYAADMVGADDQSTVSLLRWLRRQLRQQTPLRERLEAAVANDDPDEARRLIARFDFNETQRRHVTGLLDRWQETRGRG